MITIKQDKQISLMRRAGKITAEILEVLASSLKAGMKTKELDAIAEKELVKREATSSFKGYNGFPGNLCVSINDEVVHGIPGDRVIQDRDIVSLDFGVVYNGWQGDSALTSGVGCIDPKARRLIEVTREALMAGIGQGEGSFGRYFSGYSDVCRGERFFCGEGIYGTWYRKGDA